MSLLVFVMIGAIFLVLLAVTIGSAVGAFICIKITKKYATSNLRPVLKIPLIAFSIAGTALGIAIFPISLIAAITVFSELARMTHG